MCVYTGSQAFHSVLASSELPSDSNPQSDIIVIPYFCSYKSWDLLVFVIQSDPQEIIFFHQNSESFMKVLVRLIVLEFVLVQKLLR
jgi:hypothetical protein